MTALWVRLRRFVGWGAATMSMMVAGAVLVPHVVDDLEPAELLWKPTVFLLLGVPLALRGLAGYRRSAATLPDTQLLPRALSEGRFCLLLRSFGRDGQVVLPRASARRRDRVTRSFGLTPNATVEQTVARAATTTLAARVYGIVDQGTSYAPPGPDFMRVPDGRWHDVAARLIRSADVTVLLIGPDQDIGAGFAWEIECLVAADRADRVVVLLPPPDRDEFGHRAALQRAAVVVGALRGSGRLDDIDPLVVHELELTLPTTTLAIASTATGVRWWEAQRQRSEPERPRRRRRQERMVVGDLTYEEALVDAFRAIQADLLGPHDDTSRPTPDLTP